MIGLCPEHGGFKGDICPTCQTRGDPVLYDDRQVKLSKLISGALRHFPEDLGLALDEEGWTSLDDLVAGCRDRYKWATEGAVRAVIGADPKDRFELAGDRVRATYGHSADVTLGDAPKEEPLPGTLYHGTASGNLDAILVQGLSPMDRNEVHLSPDVATAREVGQRHGPDPVILAIDVDRLTTMGYQVHQRAETVYTVDQVPPDCIEIMDP